MVAGSAAAQTVAPRAAGQEERQREAQRAHQLRESRYQIGQMERVLEGAVEHGATVIRDRLQGLMPAEMLLAEDARVRGFRLDGYGVFFDVEVPALEGTLPWSFRTLNQNDLGIENALQTIRSFIEAAAGNDVNVQQAMKRIELQVSPLSPATTAPMTVSGASPVAASAATTLAVVRDAQPGQRFAEAASPEAPDPILADPNEAYRSQIRDALIDAMLEHSRGLNLSAGELLTVAARRTDARPRLMPVDTDARTVVISVRGSDLSAFLGGQISRDEARRRVQVGVF